MWRQPGEKARTVEKRQRLKHPKNRSGAEGINVPNISSKNGSRWIQQFPICFSTIWILKQTHKYRSWLLVDGLFFGGIRYSQSAEPLFLLF